METTNISNTEAPVLIGRYANVLMDRWFKRIFGWAPAKRLMQLLLQNLIPERSITELSFGPQEHINPIDRKKDIRLDVQCRDKDGNLFIVEVQLSEQSTFYERAVFNSSLVIREQLSSGSSDWGFAPVYFIGIVNFSIHKGSNRVLYRYRLRETESLETMTDRIEYIFLELPNCKETFGFDAAPLNNLCYVLGHLSEFNERPDWATGEFYDLLFNSAEICNFAPKEQNEYIKDMTTERDLANQMAFAVNKGRQEGEVLARQEIARNLLATDLSPEEVSSVTKLPLNEVKALYQ